MFRIAFWIIVVALLTPAQAVPDVPGGHFLRTVQTQAFALILSAKAELEAPKRLKSWPKRSEQLSFQADTPLPTGLAQPRASWSRL